MLLSDGRRTSGPDPLKVAQLAADRGVRVYTVGFGTKEGAEIPGAEGFSFFARLDEETLKGVAQITGAMNHLNSATQQTASASEELAATAEELSTQAQQLQEQMAFFQLDEAIADAPMKPRLSGGLASSRPATHQATQKATRKATHKAPALEST